MMRMIQRVADWDFWKDRRGQDMVEYALMAGFVAVVAGAIMPEVAGGINTVLSKVNSVMIMTAANPLPHLI
jgi:Flp pilus assembly pilin Flp